jgi:hypothetical protein
VWPYGTGSLSCPAHLKKTTTVNYNLIPKLLTGFAQLADFCAAPSPFFTKSFSYSGFVFFELKIEGTGTGNGARIVNMKFSI